MKTDTKTKQKGTTNGVYIEHHDCIFYLNVNCMHDHKNLNQCYDAMKYVVQGWDASTTGCNHALLRSCSGMHIEWSDPWVQSIQSQMPENSFICVVE